MFTKVFIKCLYIFIEQPIFAFLLQVFLFFCFLKNTFRLYNTILHPSFFLFIQYLLFFNSYLLTLVLLFLLFYFFISCLLFQLFCFNRVPQNSHGKTIFKQPYKLFTLPQDFHTPLYILLVFFKFYVNALLNYTYIFYLFMFSQVTSIPQYAVCAHSCQRNQLITAFF